MAHYGKLTRLPFLKSEELHRRLLDEEPPRLILAWLNSDAECLKVFNTQFGGRKATGGNLSEYKKGKKYAEWQTKRAGLERERSDTEFCVSLAQEAGLDLGDAGDSIFISRLLECQRANMGDPEAFAALLKGYASLRKATISRGALAVRQKELEGRLKRMDADEKDKERNSVKAFMKWASSKEAQSVLSSGKPKAVQMDLLHELMFGKGPGAKE